MINQLKRIFLPLIVFSVFLVLVFFDQQLLSQFTDDQTSPPYQIIYYAINILFWIVAAIFLNRLLKIFFWEGNARKTLKGNVPQLLIDMVPLLIYIIAVTIIIGYVFEQPLTGLWATSGVVAIVLGLALRNIILGIFTGLAVNIEKPYTIGDWIQVHQRTPEQNVVGQILEINWRATRLKTEKDTIVIIPNSIMSTLLVTNFWNPHSETRQEITYCVDFSVPVERVRRVLLAAAKEVLEQQGFLKNRQPDVLVKNTTDLGIVYEIRYWIQAWHQITPSKSRNSINTIVLRHLRTAGISLAYPKQDIYHKKMPVRHYDAATLSDRVKIVSMVELFSHLPEDAIEELANHMDHIVFKANDTIVKIGDDGDSMFIIVEGVAEVHLSENGNMVKVSQLYPGQFFGEMSLLIGEPRSADVVATTDLVAYRLQREHFSKTFEKYPHFIEKSSEILVERKYQNAQLLRELEERAATTIPENPRLLGAKIRAFFSGAKSTD